MAVKAVDAVRRALLVLEEVARTQPAGISAIARNLGLTKSSTQRALVSLAESGWIKEEAPGAARWVLAPHVLSVVLGAMRREGLRDALLPSLMELRDRSGETSFLALADGDRVILVEVVESANIVRVAVPIGSSAPAADSSSGLAMAAFLDRSSQVALLGSARRVQQLNETLAEVRRSGYAIQFGTVRLDIHSLAVPVFDRNGKPVGAVGISSPAERMSKREIGRVGTLAKGILANAGFGLPRLANAATVV